MWRFIAALTLALAVSGCSSSDEVEPPSPSSVEWVNYAPEVKERIDLARQAKDCQALQEEFDHADSNDAAQRARVGEGNGDLLTYIDDSLKYAGCY